MNAEERAAKLGIGLADYCRLANLDARIVADVMISSHGGRVRLQRWLAAGAPEPDVSRLEFAGDDSVHTFVLDVVRRAPKCVGWHAVEYVVWSEVGRSAGAWSGVVPIIRAPEGDQAHAVCINGREPDDYLPGFIAHELGHSWVRSILPVMRTITIPREDALLSASLAEGISQADLIRARLAEEQTADALAALWGSPVRRDGDDPARGLRRQLAALTAASTPVAEMAPELQLEAAV